MSAPNELLNNLDKLHTTELGVVRIKKNLSLNTDDVVGWCRTKINSNKSVITRNGKITARESRAIADAAETSIAFAGI